MDCNRVSFPQKPLTRSNLFFFLIDISCRPFRDTICGLMKVRGGINKIEGIQRGRTSVYLKLIIFSQSCEWKKVKGRKCITLLPSKSAYGPLIRHSSSFVRLSCDSCYFVLRDSLSVSVLVTLYNDPELGTGWHNKC